MKKQGNIPDMQKVIIYSRVSSKEQEETGYSLDAQIKLLEDYSHKRGLKVERIFRVAETASKWQIRKTLDEMLRYADREHVSVILCEKIDRLTRNLKDAAIVNDWVYAQEGREVHFLKENFILSSKTRAHENLVWDMKVAIARFYTNNLSEEVRKGQKEKISQGWLPTKPPLGYKTIGDKGHKIHVIDEVVAPFIRRMFELYATGNYSIFVLVEVLYKEGFRNRVGKRVGKSRMYDMLRDPFYYGDMRWKGEVSHGKHEGIVSRELFDRVQILLSRSLNLPQFNKHTPVFKAKLTCDTCGGSVTWERQKGHWYGHCNGYKRAGMAAKCEQRHVFVRQEKVEEVLLPMLVNVAPKNARVLAILNEALKETHADEVARYNAKLVELNLTTDRAQRRLENLYEDKLDAKISADTYERLFKRYSAEKEDAAKEIARLNKGNKQYYEAGYAIHELASKASEIYNSPKATTDDRRLLLSYAFSGIKLEGRTPRPEYTFAFEFLSNWVPKLNKISEPQESLEKPRQKADFSASRPVLLRG